MIHVDRGRVSPPAILSKAAASGELEEAHRHFKTATGALESRFRFKRNVWAHLEVKQALRELFRDKCAFCESRLGDRSDFNIEHFRPKSGTADLEGNYLPAHYYWLAFEWRNLYASCRRCNVAKKNLFPIAGKRASLRAPYERLEREKPLLLDPCTDRPGLILVFAENGEVGSRDERGKMTIQLYDLNRGNLADRRRESAARFKTFFAKASKAQGDLKETTEGLYAFIRPESEFAGMHRQFALQWLARTGIRNRALELFSRALDTLYEELPDVTVGDFHRGVTVREQRATVKEQKSYSSALEDYALDEKAGAEELYLQDLRIERVAVRNVKTLQDFEVELAEGVEAAPWTVLLGENGCGKSTLLQCLALTLVGEEYRKRLAIDTRPYVRDHRRIRSGTVSVAVKGFDKPLSLEVTRTRAAAKGNQDRPKVPILGYGAMRLLPKKTRGKLAALRASMTQAEREAEERMGRYARVGNLFDPSSTLIDATEWLLSLARKDPRRFKHVRRSIRYLLDLSPQSMIIPNHKQKRIEIPSLKARSLDQLSDGYQSLLAVSIDIMSVMLHHFEATESARGLVLLDELGAHLHPKWRMGIIERLRNTFPYVQFIASTHDPLCLRGARDGEVIVLRKTDRNQTYAVTDLPPVSGLRVDQLLTSEHFGLSSTLDPESERFFEEYYALLAKKDRDADDEAELERMRAQIPQHGLAGATRRERLMLEAIDYYLALEPEIVGEEKRRASQQALSKVLAKILEDTAS